MVGGGEIEVSDEVRDCGLPVFAVDHKGAAAWPIEETGRRLALRAFVFDICGAEANWNMENFIADQIELIRRQVGDKKVLLALSGGVDSSVVAVDPCDRRPAHVCPRQPWPFAQRGAGAGCAGLPQ